MKDRKQRLLPDGIPRYIRCYDNGGKTFDRFTCVFTGRYSGRSGCDYLGMSSYPYSPLGFGQHGWNETVIDRPKYSHLGSPIDFKELPNDVQNCILETYEEFWKL